MKNRKTFRGDRVYTPSVIVSSFMFLASALRITATFARARVENREVQRSQNKR